MLVFDSSFFVFMFFLMFVVGLGVITDELRKIMMLLQERLK